MNTVIFDKGDGHFAENAATAARGMFGDASVTVVGQFDRDPVEKLRAAALSVGHLRTQDFEAIIANPKRDLLIVIRVSSQGSGGMGDSFKPPYRLNGTGPWVLHLLERSTDVSEERWKEIFDALKKWGGDKSELSREVATIFDPHPEARLALSLLCEAWLMNNGEKEKQHGSIVIHAPVTADDWIDPFVKGFKNLGTAGKKQSAKDNSSKIADLVGDAKGYVKNFYDKLAKLYEEGAGEVSVGKFKGDIEALVMKLKTIAAE